ncbi:Uu.00g013840.m01.CDS01 [Anthostomella pinea]|uniref:Uu.00g013840.m01.CDS01 n=1 Tax=Anthostomella pinea TaxID=933095 RepID=A0AAI8YQC0_9PEZI|nr:Uu.00g013840.m01.CDS01 [Anthostomella pinea]
MRSLSSISAFTPATSPLAPSLRRIIESPSVIKAGSSVIGDFRRLREFLELKPQGAIELSHLHNLVTYGGGDSEDQWRKCTTGSCALAEQVKIHLGLPLKKAPVARSDWSRKRLIKEQRLYAASDAYAGFMLYHRLESKRAAMDPRPGPLLFAERYTWFNGVQGLGTQLLLVRHMSTGSDRDTIESLEVDAEEQEALVEWIAPSNTAAARGNPYQRVAKSWKPKTTGAQSSGRATSARNPLLEALKAHRERVARQKSLELYAVASNEALKGMARDRPRNTMQVKGVGKKLCDKWGDAWLNMVEKQIQDKEDTENGAAEQQGASQASSPQTTASSQPEPAPTTPSRAPPPLRLTGLSTTMERTRLGGYGIQSDPLVLDDSSDEAPEVERTESAAAPGRSDQSTPSRPPKRKRTEQQPAGPRHGLYKFFSVQKTGNSTAGRGKS